LEQRALAVMALTRRRKLSKRSRIIIIMLTVGVVGQRAVEFAR